MLASATLCAVLAAAHPSAEATAWVHVPQLSASLQRLRQTPWQPLARLWLGDGVRGALPATGGVLFGWYPTAGDTARSAAWVEADEKAPKLAKALSSWLEAIGFSIEQNGQHIVQHAHGTQHRWVFHGDGVAGWSTDAGLIMMNREPLQAHPAHQPRPTLQVFGQPLAQRDVDAFVDVPRLYGLWARQPGGRTVAGLLRRLGLDRLQGLQLQATVAGKEVRLAMDVAGVSEAGIRSVFATPIAVDWRVPKSSAVLGHVVASVKPAQVHALWAKLYGFVSPMQFTLARTQLGDVERRLGKSFAGDVLGDARRTWRLSYLDVAGRVETVLEAPVAAPKDLAQFLVPMVRGLQSFVPGLHLQERRQGTEDVYVLTRGAAEMAVVALTQDAVWVASRESALTAYRKARRQLRTVSGPKGQRAVVWGVQRDGRLVRRLRGTRQIGVWRLLAGLLREVDPGGRTLTRVMGESTWAVAQRGEHLRWQGVLHAP